MPEKKYFIRNLPNCTINKDLFEYFKVYNKLIDFIVISKNFILNSKIGFITFQTDNINLLNSLILNNKHKLKGRELNIVEARDFIQKKKS